LVKCPAIEAFGHGHGSREEELFPVEVGLGWGGGGLQGGGLHRGRLQGGRAFD